MQAKELKYLQNKHRGGLSNAKGQDYERFYVVKEIQSESDVVARFQKRFPQFDTTDKLCNFAVSLLGVWSSADHSDSEVLLLDLVRQVDEVGHGYTALILPAGELPQDIDQLMACFDELKYGIHNGMLCLQFRSMFISVPPSEALFSRLRAANPQSIKELLSVCY